MQNRIQEYRQHNFSRSTLITCKRYLALYWSSFHSTCRVFDLSWYHLGHTAYINKILQTWFVKSGIDHIDMIMQCVAVNNLLVTVLIKCFKHSMYLVENSMQVSRLITTLALCTMPDTLWFNCTLSPSACTWCMNGTYCRSIGHHSPPHPPPLYIKSFTDVSLFANGHWFCEKFAQIDSFKLCQFIKVNFPLNLKNNILNKEGVPKACTKTSLRIFSISRH